MELTLLRIKRLFNYVCQEGEIQEVMSKIPEGISAVSGLAMEFAVLGKMKM